MNYFVSLLLFFCFLVSGCVAGGSGSSLEAKKSSKGIDIRLEYFAFGGANLKKLNICEVYFGNESQRISTRVLTSEVFRKRDRVQWVAQIPSTIQSGKIFIQSTYHTKDLIGWNTRAYWTVDTSELATSYGDNGVMLRDQ